MDPAQWPAVVGADPDLTATAHTIRYSGPDRYQTNLALALALRGNGDFPFDTSDPTSAGAVGLARAHDWWGAASCPRSIIVVAGDTFADSLAASSLSDPTDRSEQPRLERVAAADPLFDPIGGFDRVDTAFAPIIVTTSARSGATSLASTARLTASDLRNGGCTSARNAIIVGGRSAVGSAIESELVSLGYGEVFRVAGADRYETAARVATALGTGTPPPAGTKCLDPVTSDGSAQMGFYGNAVAEFRLDPTSCVLLPRSVVLADGSTGADALAAGWWTSYWQVPVLLTEGDGSLPAATRTALQTLDIGSIIVLGGTARIPESTVEAAERLAGTTNSGRITGRDRYGTSVDMAKKFGGWWPTGAAKDFDGDMVCLASSSGSESAAVGWADALAAGPLCGRAGAAGGGSPARALTPVEAGIGFVGEKRPSHTSVPVLLTGTGGASLPSAVSEFLGDAFGPESSSWCRASDGAPAGCVHPGFAVVIGGPSAIPPGLVEDLTRTLSGGTQNDVDLGSPVLDGGFATTLDLAPVFEMPDEAGRTACYLNGAAEHVRWLSVTKEPARRSFVRELDLLDIEDYPDGRSQAVCVGLGTTDLAVTGVGVEGSTTQADVFRTDASRTLVLSGPISQAGSVQSDGTVSSWAFAGPSGTSVTLRRGDQEASVVGAKLDLRLTDGPRGTFVTGSLVLETSAGRIEGTIDAQGMMTAGRIELRGRSRFSFPDGEVAGGFTATITRGLAAGGTASWRFDGGPAGR